MRFIGSVIEKLQRHPKRIVFPEGTEPRVLQAARQFYSLRCGVPILLGDRPQIKQAAEKLNVSLDGIRIINPAESEELENFAKRYELLRRFKGIKEREARETMIKPNYFGAMMVAMHQADGVITGASERMGSTLRPLFQIIKVAPQTTTASSCMIMEVEDTRFGEDGVMFLASTTNDLSKIDVLSLKFENEQLVLGEFSYQETPFTSADAPPDIFEKARQAVTDRREDVFSLWISVTSSDWRSESAPAPGDRCRAPRCCRSRAAPRPSRCDSR